MEYLSEIFIGLPVAPNSGMGFLYLKKTKWRTAHPEGVTCPTPNFCWEEKGQWQSIWDEHKIIAWSYWSYIRAE